MPLLLRGLDLPDMGMRADVIETLYSTTRDESSPGEAVQAAMSEHAPSLVIAMLKNGMMHELSLSVGFLLPSTGRCLSIAEDAPTAAPHGCIAVSRHFATGCAVRHPPSV